MNNRYLTGLSPFSGLPISSNFGTVGVNYNISNDSWSGNVSAWQVDQRGWTFNPSISIMVFPEQTTNFVRGHGFSSNNQVLSNFVTNNDQQGALNYFGFKGTYDPTIKDPNYGDGYYGATGTKTGNIFFGDYAFQNYATLYGTYMKELYTSCDIANGTYKKLPSDLQGLGIDKDLEETYGYVYAYKNQGLYRGNKIPWMPGIKYYQSQLMGFGVPYPSYPSSFLWIYKIPRLW